MAHDEAWTLEVTPHRGLFELRLRELLHYRDLLYLLVRRDFVANFKQTLLGPAWFAIKPILTTLVFIVVFGRIAGLSSDGLPRLLFYLSGVTLWALFSDGIAKTASTFSANAQMFQKVYFPRLIVPLATAGSNLLRFAIQLAIFFALATYYTVQGSIEPNLYALALPAIVVVLSAQAMGFGLLFSSLTTKYRDLQFLLSFAIQLAMYATPIIYPASSIPDAYAPLLHLNPVTPAIELFRLGFLGAGTVSGFGCAYSVGVTLVVLFAGIVVFNRVEAHVMDTV